MTLMLPVADAPPGIRPSRLLNRMKKKTVRGMAGTVRAVAADGGPGDLVADEQDERLEGVHERPAADGTLRDVPGQGDDDRDDQRRRDHLHHHEPGDLEREWAERDHRKVQIVV